MSINHFEYRYGYLASHYPLSIVFAGRIYPSAENLYWSILYPDLAEKCSYLPDASIDDRLHVMSANEAGIIGTRRQIDAVKHNRAMIIHPSVQIEAMRLATSLKFKQHPNFKEKLMSTKQQLVYTNTCDDRFWGMSPDEDGHLVGQNNLGKILMELRKQYLKEAKETA